MDDWSALHFYGNYFLYYFVVIFLGGIWVTLCSLISPTNPSNTKFPKHFVNCVSGLFNIEYAVRGADKVPSENEAFIVAANHQSFFDFVTIMNIWPSRCVCIVKSSLFWMSGPFGLAMWLCGNIFVDRGNSSSSRKTLDAAVQRIQNERLRVWVYPEGTRNDNGTILPFKKGAFHMAVQAQIPVVPVVISSYNSWADYSLGRWRPRRFVIVEVLDPVSTKGLSGHDVNDLTTSVHEKMLSRFEVVSKEASDSILPRDKSD